MVPKVDHIPASIDHYQASDCRHATISVGLCDRVEGGVTALVGAVGLVTVAALTPGPNNLIVLRTASRAGIAGTLPAIAGVVLGGLATAVLASALALAAEPSVLTAAGIAGCIYLGWLGLDLIRHAGRTPAAAAGLPAVSVWGLFVFQFLNPKSWVMVVSAIGASPAGDAASRWPLALVFTAIPAVCLLLWASLGAAMARVLARPRVALWTDRTMGLLLVATAFAMACGG
jgi:threonine/homoserine/homoserine lactone efflux protein